MVYCNISRDTFVFYKRCMKVIGIWPQDRHKWRSAIIFWVTTTLQVAMVTIRLADYAGSCYRYEFNRYQFNAIVWQAGSIITKLSFRACEAQKESLIESTTNDWSTITDLEERKVMISHDKRGSSIFAIQAIVITIESVRRFLRIVRKKSDNVQETCAFDVNYLRGVVNTFLEFTAMGMGSLMAWSTLALFWSFAMHLSAQYKILKMRFHNLLLIEDKKKSLQVFRQLVERHNQLFALSRDYENSFNAHIMTSILARQIHVCISAVSLTADMKTLNFFGGARNLYFVTVALLGIFAIYYTGDYQTDCCQEVGEEFTQCNWDDLPKEFRTNYSIVASRCRMPPQLKIVKTYKLNLSNFKYALQALHSYVSLIAAITK